MVTRWLRSLFRSGWFRRSATKNGALSGRMARATVWSMNADRQLCRTGRDGEWIDRAAARLGIEPGDYITLSYGRLFDQWREQHRSDAQDLTFAAVSGAA